MKEKLIKKDFSKLKCFGLFLSVLVFGLSNTIIRSGSRPLLVSLLASLIIAVIFIVGYFWICKHEERHQLAIEIRGQEYKVISGLYLLVSELTAGRGMIEKEKIGLRYSLKIFYIDASPEEQKLLLSKIVNYLKNFDEIHVCYSVEITGLSTNNDKN